MLFLNFSEVRLSSFEKFYEFSPHLMVFLRQIDLTSKALLLSNFSQKLISTAETVVLVS